MKIAIIGSRTITITDFSSYLPSEISEIVSGGARGIDQAARDYALSHHIKLTEFLPNYTRYGRAAPIRRNTEIIDYADEVLAFWNGSSKGTKNVIETCRKRNKKITVHLIAE